MPETARVALRELEETDAGAVYTLLSDERVVRYMLFPLFTEERAREFVAQSQAQRHEEPRKGVTLAVARRSDDSVIGLCGLLIEPQREDAEMWYLLHPDQWGQGLMTEAVRLLAELGFERFGLHRLWASCLPANPSSAAVLVKVGMRQEGYLKQNLRIHGRWEDSYLYAMLRDEWKQADRTT